MKEKSEENLLEASGSFDQNLWTSSL